jgi:hypothetical protein
MPVLRGASFARALNSGADPVEISTDRAPVYPAGGRSARPGRAAPPRAVCKQHRGSRSQPVDGRATADTRHEGSPIAAHGRRGTHVRAEPAPRTLRNHHRRSGPRPRPSHLHRARTLPLTATMSAAIATPPPESINATPPPGLLSETMLASEQVSELAVKRQLGRKGCGGTFPNRPPAI